VTSPRPGPLPGPPPKESCPPGATRAPLLQLDGISKRFGALVANDGISLSLDRGEVLALLGENGAGKSTLVSILFGHYLADAGRILVDGQPLPPGNPAAALAAGIGMVHQHFSLADNLSVLDNVLLGTESLWQPFSRRAAARAALAQTAQRFGLQVNPDARIADLSVGERQRVEILKALLPFGRKAGARVLILDEPTAVLTPQESESLFHTLGQLVAQGLAIIFISHKLDEVLRVSQRIAVLRAGKLVAELPAAGASKAQLAQAMVGRAVARVLREPGARPVRASAPVCELQGVTVRGHGAWPQLDAVQLALHPGEVVAIAGVAGNGQHALADLLHGLIGADAGTVTVAGQALPPAPRAWVDAGVARIPEDRHAVGVVGDLPLWENAVLERSSSPAFARWGVVRRAAAMAHAQGLVTRFDVRGTEGGGLATITRGLSGGNMQKLILGRALVGDPDHSGPPLLIVANQPTWGLDIGAVAYVHRQLLDACAAGAALLLISEDLDEIFALADRIAVMHHGQLTDARPAADWTLPAIGLAMAGAAAREGAHAA
jgi:general nucleoside transport system ATP-binding protein